MGFDRRTRVVGEFEEGGFASGAVSRLLPHQQGILQLSTQTGAKLLRWSQRSVFFHYLNFTQQKSDKSCF